MWCGGGRIGLSVPAPFDLETFRVAQVADVEQQSASLETELAQTHAELDVASQQLAQHENAANESIRQNETQQQATIDDHPRIWGSPLTVIIPRCGSLPSELSLED